MSKRILILFLMIAIVGVIFTFESADAKKTAKGGITEEDMTAMSATVDKLTKKMYGNCLFSPEDNEDLIDVKIKLDNQMLIASDPSLAPMYYKLGILYKSRDMKDEAIECFQTVLENFASTALAPKSATQLKLMGVAVAAPLTPGASAGAGTTPTPTGP